MVKSREEENPNRGPREIEFVNYEVQSIFDTCSKKSRFFIVDRELDKPYKISRNTKNREIFETDFGRLSEFPVTHLTKIARRRRVKVHFLFVSVEFSIFLFFWNFLIVFMLLGFQNAGPVQISGVSPGGQICRQARQGNRYDLQGHGWFFFIFVFYDFHFCRPQPSTKSISSINRRTRSRPSTWWDKLILKTSYSLKKMTVFCRMKKKFR